MNKPVWQEFSTERVHLAVRERRWAEFGSDTISEMVVKPLDATNFKARIQLATIGSYGYAFIESTPALASSSAMTAGKWGSDSSDCLLMTVADEGCSHLSQGHWTSKLNSGDIAIRDLTKPWESRSLDPIKLILIKIPYSRIARHHPDPDRLVGQQLSALRPSVGFASTILRASRHALLAEPDSDWHDCLNDILDDVFKLVCRVADPQELAQSARIGSTIRREALAYIARHLADPDLSVTTVASAIGVSTRHLQRIFLATGMSPRGYILEQRLLAAEAKLRQSGACDGAKVSDVAFEIGFNDASHFSRTFAARFGCSPSMYRRRAD